MQYEVTGKKLNKDSAKNALQYELKQFSTSTMLWHVVKRHKFGLVSTWAVVITLLYFVPFLPDLILSTIF